MAKGAYFGVNSLAKKIKKMYIGVGGIAHKVKKAYIGIAGKARVWFSGGEPEYSGTVSSLSIGRTGYCTECKTPTHCVFGGGVHFDGTGGKFYSQNTAEAYSYDLTSMVLTPLSNITRYNRGCSTGQYALVAGGEGNSVVKSVDAYDSSLTKSVASNLTYGGMHQGAARVGDFALFAGGYPNTDSKNIVDVYDSSLTKQSSLRLVVTSYYMGSTTFNSKAVFAGGKGGTKTKTDYISVFDESLTREQYVLSSARSGILCLSISDTLLCIGGASGRIVDMYNYDMTLTTTTFPFSDDMTSNSHFGSSTGDFGIIFTGKSNNTQIIDSDLTLKFSTDVNKAINAGFSGVIGDTVIIGGGYFTNSSDNSESPVEMYSYSM